MRQTIAIVAMVLISLALIPSGSIASGKTATVRVEYPGTYYGSIKGDDLQEVEGEGTMDFQTSGDIIYVIMNKVGEDNWEMKVSIIVDGNVRVSKSTTDPMGEVRLSYSLGAEGDGEDGENGTGCGSYILLALVLLSFVTLALYLRKRR